LPNHFLHLLIDSHLNPSSNFKSIVLDSLTNQQWSLVKGYLVDMANRSYKCFPSFSPLNSEFSSGLRIIDTFSECISFNIQDKRKDIKLRAQELDDMVLESSSFPSVTIVASRITSPPPLHIFIWLINP